MEPYTLYPSVDSNYNFPPQIRSKIAAAPELIEAFASVSDLNDKVDKMTVGQYVDPLAYVDNLNVFMQVNARPEGTLWPQGFSVNEQRNEVYIAMSGIINSVNTLRIYIHNLDGTVKQHRSITTEDGTSTEGLPWFYNSSGELCFIVRPFNGGHGYAIFNYTRNTRGSRIEINGRYKSDVVGNLFVTCDQTSAAGGVGTFWFYDWESVKNGSPILLDTISLSSRNYVSKLQSFTINGNYIMMNQGLSKTEPYLSIYTMHGELLRSYQFDKAEFADALNADRSGTISDRNNYRHESEGAWVYKGHLLTGHVTDNNTSSYLFSIVMHNRIDGYRVSTLPQLVASPRKDTGWIPLPKADGVLDYSESAPPEYRVKSGILYFRGAVKGVPTNPTSFLVGTLPLGHRPIGIPHQSAQVTSSGKTANWQINTAGTIYILNSQNAGSETAWYPLPSTPIIVE